MLKISASTATISIWHLHGAKTARFLDCKKWKKTFKKWFQTTFVSSKMDLTNPYGQVWTLTQAEVDTERGNKSDIIGCSCSSQLGSTDYWRYFYDFRFLKVDKIIKFEMALTQPQSRPSALFWSTSSEILTPFDTFFTAEKYLLSNIIYRSLTSVIIGIVSARKRPRRSTGRICKFLLTGSTKE